MKKGVAVSTVEVGNYKIFEKSSKEGYSLNTSVKKVYQSIPLALFVSLSKNDRNTFYKK